MGAGLSGAVIAERASKVLGLKVSLIAFLFMNLANYSVNMLIKFYPQYLHLTLIVRSFSLKIILITRTNLSLFIVQISFHCLCLSPLILLHLPFILCYLSPCAIQRLPHPFILFSFCSFDGPQSLVIDKRPHIAGNCYDYIDEHGIRTSL